MDTTVQFFDTRSLPDAEHCFVIVIDCTLFPASPDEFIPKNSPVRLVNHIVDQLDITPVLQTYEGGGTSSYYPRMLLEVIFYAYMNNIYSCRKIERALQENVYYMYLSDKQFPSCSTINRYRSKRLKACINSLFVQVVTMLVEMGWISLEVQYVDGTKIESVANKYTFVWRKNVERNRAKLQTQIASILMLLILDYILTWGIPPLYPPS